MERNGDIREGERRYSGECVEVDERKECIKEIQKETDAEKRDLSVWKQLEFGGKRYSGIKCFEGIAV